jgi:hypothetical protein
MSRRPSAFSSFSSLFLLLARGLVGIDVALLDQLDLHLAESGDDLVDDVRVIDRGGQVFLEVVEREVALVFGELDEFAGLLRDELLEIDGRSGLHQQGLRAVDRQGGLLLFRRGRLGCGSLRCGALGGGLFDGLALGRAFFGRLRGLFGGGFGGGLRLF